MGFGFLTEIDSQEGVEELIGVAWCAQLETGLFQGSDDLTQVVRTETPQSQQLFRGFPDEFVDTVETQTIQQRLGSLGYPKPHDLIGQKTDLCFGEMFHENSTSLLGVGSVQRQIFIPFFWVSVKMTDPEV